MRQSFAGRASDRSSAQRNQRDLIDQAAQILGKTRSDFMLETACREAEDVLLDQRVFVLDAAAFATFQARDHPRPRVYLGPVLQQSPE